MEYGVSQQLTELFKGTRATRLAPILRVALLCHLRSRTDMAQGRRIRPLRHHSSSRQCVNLRLGELDDP